MSVAREGAHWLPGLTAALIALAAAGDAAASVVSVWAEPLENATLIPGGPVRSVFRLHLRNAAAAAETLTAVRFNNLAAGAGTEVQMDASWSALTLGDESGALGTGTFAGGDLSFTGLAVVIAPGDTTTLTLEGGASTTARDGDVLDVAVVAATNLTFSRGVPLAATWPLHPAGEFAIDGMSANQIVVHPVPAGNLLTGATHNLVFDVTIPANGYEPDVLQKVNVLNHGTATPATGLDAVQAWADNGNGSFDPTLDRPLGTLSFTGDRWELTALAEPVGVNGLRLFVSVDIAPAALVGTTMRLSLVESADRAIEMASGNDGPVDDTVGNAFTQVVSAANRVTFSAVPIATGVVSPGQHGIAVLAVVATNSYDNDHTMSTLHVTNGTESTHGASQVDRDAAIGNVILRLDANANGVLDDVITDPVLGSTSFSAGRASFRGLAASIPAGGSRTFFVEVDLSVALAADGDRVCASIQSALDVAFEQPTTVVAGWPLDSGARWIIDGLVASQVVSVGVPAATFGPGDGPTRGLEIVVPSNGYAADELKGLQIVNLGTAGPTHISDLRLWRDGGNGSFDAGAGDDADVGPLVPVSGGWASPQLAESVPVGGVRLYVAFSVPTSFADSATVQFAVPIGGIVMNSANDGPLDEAIRNPATLQLSPAPILSSIQLANASTVGQGIAARMIVRNVSGEALNNVAPRDLQVAGSGVLSLVSGPIPASLNLAIGAVDTFTFNFTAQSVGSITLTGRAEGLGAQSNSPRSSILSTSPRHDVLVEAAELGMVPVGSLPLSLTRGQTNAVALHLTLLNTTGPSGSNVELLRMRIRFEDGNGNDIVPGDLISRLAVGEGTTTYYATTAVPTSGSEMDLTLDTPVVVTGQEPVTVTLRLDISPTTVVPQFRLAIQDPTWFVARDAVNGASVPVVLHVGSFPIRSGIGELSEAPTRLDVAAVGAVDGAVAQAQLDAPLLHFDLANPGVPDLTTDVLFGALALQLVDDVGNIVPLQEVFDQVRLVAGSVQLAEVQLAYRPDSTLAVTLDQPLLVSSRVPIRIDVVGDVRADAPRTTYRLRLADRSSVLAVDPNTGLELPVSFVPEPLQGGRITIQGVAAALLASGRTGFSAFTVVGLQDQPAMHVTLRHPGPADIGAVRVDALTIGTRDEHRSPLVPSRFLERVRVLVAGAPVGSLPSLPSSGTGFQIPLSGVVLNAGESVELTVSADIEATAPESFLELVLLAAGVHAVDANNSTSVPVSADAGAELPLTSGVTKLEAPARELRVALTNEMPAVLAADGSAVRMASVTFSNPAPENSGAIRVNRLSVHAADRDLAALDIGAFAARVEARLGGAVWAASDSLTPDSLTATLVPNSELQVMPGTSVALQLFVTLRPQAALPRSIRIGITATSVGVVQPSSAVVQVRVTASGAPDFPLWTLPGSFSELSLRESYANFPNPFAAGREPTAFTFYLRTDARVTLRILTPRGETVLRVLDGESRSAGLHQADVWNGLNERGLVVLNGVYVAELRVDYADGTTERALHKVAVLR